MWAGGRNLPFPIRPAVAYIITATTVQAVMSTLVTALPFTSWSTHLRSKWRLLSSIIHRDGIRLYDNDSDMSDGIAYQQNDIAYNTRVGLLQLVDNGVVCLQFQCSALVAS